MGGDYNVLTDVIQAIRKDKSKFKQDSYGLAEDYTCKTPCCVAGTTCLVVYGADKKYPVGGIRKSAMKALDLSPEEASVLFAKEYPIRWTKEYGCPNGLHIPNADQAISMLEKFRDGEIEITKEILGLYDENFLEN